MMACVLVSSSPTGQPASATRKARDEHPVGITADLRAAIPPRAAQLQLPRPHEVESRADPKQILQQCILRAADVTGRKRENLRKRFPQHRRQLLERLDRFGQVTALSSWKQLTADIDAVVARWKVREDG